MKLRLWSDLHLEFSKGDYDHIWTPAPENRDQIALLAGDIYMGNLAVKFISELCDNFKMVFYTCGNHEFYNQDFNFVIDDWRRFELNGPKNFRFMYNDWHQADGLRVLGGTMWTSLNNGDHFTKRICQKEMNDYNNIRCGGLRITPEFTIEENRKFMEFITKKMDEPFDGKTVVITHHSPGSMIKR